MARKQDFGFDQIMREASAKEGTTPTTPPPPTWPCTMCRGSGWQFVTESQVIRCTKCNGVKYVLSRPKEVERLTLPEFLARHPGFEWGQTPSGRLDTPSQPDEPSTASEAAPSAGRSLLP